tara:strand:- start:90 stop:530 length:441 start_codon:yes stop_codon:yes gene_type:complete
MTRYIYAEVAYETLDEVEEAVTAMKARLDNNPNDWCVVKPSISSKTLHIGGNDVVAYAYGDPLTDEEINKLDTSETVYNVFSVNDADNYTEVSEASVAEKIRTMRASYGRWLAVDKYFDSLVENGELLISHNVTNEDMSVYVTNPS